MWWLLAALATGGGFGGGATLRWVDPPRPNPFTSDDAALLRSQLVFEMLKLEHEIRQDMPPGPTRERIEALERAVSQLMAGQDREWHPPTWQFAEE